MPLPENTFRPGSKHDLEPVSARLSELRDMANNGKLWLDLDAAHELIKVIADVKYLVMGRIQTLSSKLDVSLHFGDNFVSRAISERLQRAAAGSSDAIVPVLAEFYDELDQVEYIVKRAANLVKAHDDAATQQLGQRQGEI